jgi:hypothetical protein
MRGTRNSESCWPPSAMRPNDAMGGLFKSPGPREPLSLLPAWVPGTCPSTGVPHWGGTRGARLGCGRARPLVKAKGRSASLCIRPSKVKQVLSPGIPQDSILVE